MRYLAIFVLISPLAALGQSAPNDSRTMETLLAEVRELRLAIERSTLLGARTQLAISQLQLQESRATRLGQEHNSTQEAHANLTQEKSGLAAALRDLEARTPVPGDNHESHVKDIKFQLERVTAAEQRLAAREGETASQLQAAQRDVQDSRAWILQMQQSLDAAIQQMLKPRQ